MNTRTKIAASIVTVGLSAAVVKTMHHYYQDIYTRFPELDRKVARKAFRKLLLKSAAQNYTDEQLSSYDNIDKLFLAEYDKLKTA